MKINFLVSKPAWPFRQPRRLLHNVAKILYGIAFLVFEYVYSYSANCEPQKKPRQIVYLRQQGKRKEPNIFAWFQRFLPYNIQSLVEMKVHIAKKESF